MTDYYNFRCECAFTTKVKYYEKDSPYSSTATWYFEAFDTSTPSPSQPVQMSLSEALKASNPHCPNCNKVISESDFLECN